jgi:hypothetical protein
MVAKFWFSVLTVNCVTRKYNFVIFTAYEFYFDAFKLGGLHKKYPIAS